MRKKSGLAVAGAMMALAQAAAGQVYEANLELDHRAIRYWDVPLADPVTKLAALVARGDIELTFRPEGQGYLPALLRALGVGAESQVLVFSKTSLRAPLLGSPIVGTDYESWVWRLAVC